MNDRSYQHVIDRLDEDTTLSSEVVDCVLAAAEGRDALAAHLDELGMPARREGSSDAPAPEPARVYLEQISVENFRGIARRSRLPLEPGPGLTLVVGRNGSGKSSFAEGLELLLTGSNLRWADRTRVWKQGWRNLHGVGPTVLSARFRVDGERDALEVTQRWAEDAGLDDGEPRTVSGPRGSWEELGWVELLDRFRPLLSYNELGAMFSTRAAALYEALSGVLGLEDFDELGASLRAARLEREKSGKDDKKLRDSLRARIAEVSDPRADAITALIAARSPDLDAVASIVTGAREPAEAVDLRAVATLGLPEPEAIAGAFEKLRVELDRARELEASDAERLDALADLLSKALLFHERHGDNQTCPVCGTEDVLDPGWSIRSQAEIEDARHKSAELRSARASLTDAKRALGQLFPQSIPALLRAAGDAGLEVRNAQEAWDPWADALAHDAPTLLAVGPAAAATLRERCDAARAVALADQDRRDASWKPIEADVIAWLGAARQAARDKALVATLKAAEKWSAELTADLRRERLAPVVAAAQANWSELRHESNVALGKVELRKEGMQRYAAFDVTVDGTEASAFGVMSQGELSALAVSIFLPRASLPETPFGFMVIDDPVQSMDPAKVDGLARVLGRAAQQRQVIVFTHDERLPEAVRRLGIDARIVSVNRRAKSQIEIVAGRPPSDRYIGEALALAKTEDLPDEVRARVVPGFCRSAIEAACAARIRRRMIEAGIPHADVEAALEAKTSLNTWLADLFELSTAQGEQIREHLRRLAGPDAIGVVRLAQRGTHQLVLTDGLKLANGAKTLVKAIEAG